MDIKKFLPGVQKDISLAKYTTFKIGGPARYFFIAKNKDDLIKAIKAAKKFKLRFFILGGGSNVLFSDKGFNGLVIKIASLRLVSRRLKNCKLLDRAKRETPHRVAIKNCNLYAEAGMKLEDIVKLSVKESLTGLEWAAGIPGTVGGAVYGNAGAFNSVIGNIVESVEVLDIKTLESKNFSQKNCKFSQKSTIFKNRKDLIILFVILKLKKGNKKQIQKKIKEYLNYRKKNHPFNFFSAGCAFENYKILPHRQAGKIKNKKLLKEFPELKEFNKMGMIPAAFLVEKSGLKGKKIGNAQISTKHANFIVNLKKAKAKDVIKLIKLAKRRVKKKFGVDLKEEVRIVD